MTFLATPLGLIMVPHMNCIFWGGRYGLHLVERDFSPNRKWLFIPMAFMTLYYVAFIKSWPKQLTVHHWETLGRSSIRNLEIGTEEGTVEQHFLLIYDLLLAHLTFLYNPFFFLVFVLPTIEWTIDIYNWFLKCITDMPTGQCDRGNFLIVVLSFQKTPVYVYWTKINQNTW